MGFEVRSTAMVQVMVDQHVHLVSYSAFSQLHWTLVGSGPYAREGIERKRRQHWFNKYLLSYLPVPLHGHPRHVYVLPERQG